jgi:hypothetical protein
MGLHNLLKRTKDASPMVPALGYTAVLTLVNLAVGFSQSNMVVVGAQNGIVNHPTVAVVGFLVWIAAAILLFVIVTWYRDDDWLAAGFLLGLTLILGGIIAGLIAKTVLTLSVADAMFAAAGAPFALLLRAIITVPVCGGIVALARWLTRLVRPTAPSRSTRPSR